MMFEREHSSLVQSLHTVEDVALASSHAYQRRVDASTGFVRRSNVA
jgi:hypothetical protein